MGVIKKHTTGSLKVLTTTISEVAEVNLDVTVNTGDVTPIGVSWEQAIELHKSWTLSARMFYNPLDTGQALIITAYTSGSATLTSLTFLEDATGSYAGSCIVTSAQVTKAVGSPDMLSASFRGNAALTRTAGST